jgi:hypothetical protein
MFARRLVVGVLLLAACIVAVLQPAGPASAQEAVVGTWTGLGLQVFRDGRTTTWTIRMRINADGNGTIDYPSLSCGGTLTRLRSSGEITEYREQLNYGLEKCTNNGTVGILPRNNKLIWYWTGEATNNPDGADTAVLRRSN